METFVSYGLNTKPDVHRGCPSAPAATKKHFSDHQKIVNGMGTFLISMKRSLSSQQGFPVDPVVTLR
jgi:hypothetical protein